MTELRMHLERSADPEVLDWIVQDGLVTGDATFAPGTPAATGVLPPALVELLDAGALSEIVVSAGRIRFVRGETSDWRELAPLIQSLLAGAFQAGAVIRAAQSSAQADQRLAEGVREVLLGVVGDLVRSHGGELELLGVEAGVVKLGLHGACQGCPSAGQTLKVGIEARLRQRFPALTAVESS